MGRDTDFNFGWNETANNADPWGRSTGPDERGTAPKTRIDAEKTSGPVSQDAKRDKNGNRTLDNIELTCNYVKHQIKLMTDTVRKANRVKPMPSASQLLKNAGGADGGTLLHGSDVPKKTSRFKIKITGFREAPDGFKGAIGILDIQPVFDCSAWALNKTNFKALMNKLGDNTDKWTGKAVELQVIQVRNPSSGTTGPSLAVVN